jgi:hypothetical protein
METQTSHLLELIERAEALVATLDASFKGDLPGHEFHGNQWTEGGGGGGDSGSSVGRSRIDRGEGDFRHYAENDDAEVNQTLGESNKAWEKGLSAKRENGV